MHGERKEWFWSAADNLPSALSWPCITRGSKVLRAFRSLRWFGKLHGGLKFHWLEIFCWRSLFFLAWDARLAWPTKKGFPKLTHFFFWGESSQWRFRSIKNFPISSNVVQAYKKQQELEAQHDLKDRKWCTWKQLAGIWLTHERKEWRNTERKKQGNRNPDTRQN